MLALDPPGDPTIGACLAGDLSGPRRHRFGAMRDLVIGVTVVLADGTIASSGRQGREERRRLRPRQALLRLARPARPDRARRAAAPSAPPPRRRSSPRPTIRAELWRELQRSQLVPSAVDFLPPGRFALLFEGGEAAVAEQVATAPGEVPDTSRLGRARSARSPAGAVRSPGSRLRARPARRRDRLRREAARPRWSPLAERVRAAFDPEGVLV